MHYSYAQTPFGILVSVDARKTSFSSRVQGEKVPIMACKFFLLLLCTKHKLVFAALFRPENLTQLTTFQSFQCTYTSFHIIFALANQAFIIDTKPFARSTKFFVEHNSIKTNSLHSTYRQYSISWLCAHQTNLWEEKSKIYGAHKMLWNMQKKSEVNETSKTISLQYDSYCYLSFFRSSHSAPHIQTKQNKNTNKLPDNSTL